MASVRDRLGVNTTMIPGWPTPLGSVLQAAGLGYLWTWWQEFRSFFMTRMDTQGDVTFTTIEKGPVVWTPDGSAKYRLGVDNAGNPTSTLIP